MAEHRSESAPERPEDQNPRRPTNRFALAAMVLGLVSVLLTVSGCFCPLTWAFSPVAWVIAPVAAILAIVCGLIARGQFKLDDEAAGSRMATSGIVMGGVMLILSLVMLLGAYLGWGLSELEEVGNPVPDEPTGEYLEE